MADTADFTGTDGDDLDTLTGWSTQVGTANTFEVLSNELAAANWTDKTLVTFVDQSSADCYIQAKFVYFAGSRQKAFIVLRAVDADNWVGIKIHGTGAAGVRLTSCIAGTLDDTHIQAQGAANDIYKVEASGTTYELFINAVSQGTATIASASTTEKSVGVVMHGSGSTGASGWIDDLEAGVLGGGGGLAIPIAAYHYNHPMRA